MGLWELSNDVLLIDYYDHREFLKIGSSLFSRKHQILYNLHVVQWNKDCVGKVFVHWPDVGKSFQQLSLIAACLLVCSLVVSCIHPALGCSWEKQTGSKKIAKN